MLTKYASFEVSKVLEVKGSASARHASLDKISDYHDYRTDDGYLYARIIAISSRINKNNDGWPSVELAGGEEIWNEVRPKLAKTGAVTLAANSQHKYGYSTFVGKPIFIDHHNSDPKRARGVIVDAKLHVEDAKTSKHDPYYSSSGVDAEHLPPTKVELLLEIDAKSFPKLARAVVEGSKDSTKGIDGFSMGCDVERSKCSHCGKVATSPQEYCSHIRMKGAHHDFVTTADDGTTRKESRKSYENCYGIKFFEISAVFDPADETALLQELIDEGSHTAAFDLPPEVGQATPDPDAIMAEALRMQEKGIMLHKALELAERKLRQQQDPSYFIPVRGTDTPPVENTVLQQYYGPNKPVQIPPDTPVRQGSYLQHKLAGDNPLPQFMHTRSPEEVDTLREDKVCPVCGEQMEGEKCSVCGHIEEPKGFDNPDLQKARMQPDMPEVNQAEAPNSAQGELLEGAPEPGESSAVSYLQAKKKGIPPTVMSSTEVTAGKIKSVERPIKPGTRPATDEPRETVISDQDKPVTAAFRTAMDLIQAAKRNQGNNMTQSKIAADPADSSGRPDKRVDTEGVGGVMDDSNPAASKPDKSADVEGKGGIIQDSNAEASDENTKTESLPTAGRDSDDSGFNKDKTTQDSGPTKTFDNSNEPASAVTDKAFPTSHTTEAAKTGVKPLGGPDTQPQRRENLEQESGFSNPQDGTDQWTGVGGNGVTRQQDPVTKKVDPNITQPRSSSFAHVLAAMKLADAEIELGLLDQEKKYDRVAELEGLTPEELAAETRVVSRVRTAGLAKQATRREAATRPGEVAGRVPSFKRVASEPVEPVRVNDEFADSAIFMR